MKSLIKFDDNTEKLTISRFSRHLRRSDDVLGAHQSVLRDIRPRAHHNQHSRPRHPLLHRRLARFSRDSRVSEKEKKVREWEIGILENSEAFPCFLTISQAGQSFLTALENSEASLMVVKASNAFWRSSDVF